MNNAERRKVETTVAALDRAMGDTSEVVKLRLDEVEVRNNSSQFDGLTYGTFKY